MDCMGKPRIASAQDADDIKSGEGWQPGERHMLRVGLTGGVACGKTTVAQMLRTRGAHILLADELAHELMNPGEAVYARVVERFGREILNADGSISRPKLAELAFAGRIQELNAIVHPAVLEAEDRWMDEVGQRDPGAITVCEAALLYEAGGHERFDRIIVVTCPLESKVRRFAQRSGISLEAARADVERRISAQWPDEAKVARADYVIENSGALEATEQQVEKVWRQLLRAAERLPSKA
jgi:dephospho-CoA kinase